MLQSTPNLPPSCAFNFDVIKELYSKLIFTTADIWPCNGDGFAVDIYSREEWGARDPNCIDTMPTPVEYIFIHHTEGSECSSVSECGAVLRGIQNYHMDTLGA